MKVQELRVPPEDGYIEGQLGGGGGGRERLTEDSDVVLVYCGKLLGCWFC